MRLILKILGALLALIVLGVGLAIAATAVVHVQTRTLPLPTGPSAVGRIELDLRDESRVDPFASDGRKRELSAWIWYPATKPSGTRAPYLPKAWADEVNAARGVMGWSFQDLNAVRTNSFEQAQLAGKPPAVVLQPGLGLSAPEYSALAEDLASWGYAVIGISETGSSSVVVFPDGHLARSTAAGSLAETASLAETYADSAKLIGVWADDAAFVTSTLNATPPVIGPLDFSKTAYIGHSLGGATALEICRNAKVCSAAVNLDGTVWSEVRHTGTAVPSLILSATPAIDPCDEFCQAASADEAHLRSTGVRQIAVQGTRHFNFTDYSVLFAPLLYSLDQLGPIDGSRVVVITREVVRTFLDQAVRRAAPAALTATLGRYSELRER